MKLNNDTFKGLLMGLAIAFVFTQIIDLIKTLALILSR